MNTDAMIVWIPLVILSLISLYAIWKGWLPPIDHEGEYEDS